MLKYLKWMGVTAAATLMMMGSVQAGAPREATPTAFDPVAHQRVVEVVQKA